MASREKEVVTDEKRKRSALRTRVWIDFDPKSPILTNQDDILNYVKKHRGRLPSLIKIEFCPATIVKEHPPAGCVYFHPKS